MGEASVVGELRGRGGGGRGGPSTQSRRGACVRDGARGPPAWRNWPEEPGLPELLQMVTPLWTEVHEVPCPRPGSGGSSTGQSHRMLIQHSRTVVVGGEVLEPLLRLSGLERLPKLKASKQRWVSWGRER